jgi:hypothetical protein
MSAVNELRAVRAIVADPAHWTQGAYAKDSIGLQVTPQSNQAVCFCLAGALHKAKANYMAGRFVENLTGIGDIIDWNDAPGRTHDQVLDLLDRAILAADTKRVAA